MKVWLIGSGSMAKEYVKVLKSLDVEFIVIGRSTLSAKNFQIETGIPVETGGLELVLSKKKAPELAIVAVNVEELVSVAKSLVKKGTRRILLEKPGGIKVIKLKELEYQAKSFNSKIWLAYNRRFYSAILQAEEMIAHDGGLKSLHFEFTEWSHQIQYLKKAPEVMKHWVLANSSHVIDLAFYLAGFPSDWKCWHSGGVDWHPTSSRFCGSGVTEKEVFFSYFADWEAPGRWGVEAMTSNRRFIFKPIEKLQVITLGSVNVDLVDLKDRLDQDFKPGLYQQTQAFLLDDSTRFCTLSDQIKHVKIFSQIAGYSI